MAYSKVHISNSTPYTVDGTVNYLSAFCSDDKFKIQPWGEWTAGSRGVCLLTKISANVHTPESETSATSYESSGTSYSQFIIAQTKTGEYVVTRKVT
ncbi:MAG: hypothetical protein LIP16_18495 [Clostridium sp.]|nr:hypothetical protein [Clostridium sp.]